MALIGPIKDKDWVSVRQAVARLGSEKLGVNSTPTFAGITITGDVILSSLAANRLVSTDDSQILTSVADLTSWVAGTSNQVIVTDDTDGTITLSAPQDLHRAAANFTVAGLTVTNNTPAGFVDMSVENTSTSTNSLTQARARFKVGNQADGAVMGMTQFGSSFDGSAFFYNVENGGFIIGTNNIRRLDITKDGEYGFNEIAPETFVEFTSGVPYITIHNSTHEDADGGRESRLLFKGEQSGGEETTLVQIEISHDGTADDEKGKVVISLNDGSGGDTPTDQVTIQSELVTFAGDITATGLNLTALGSLPSLVVVGKMIHLTTNNRFYMGRNL